MIDEALCSERYRNVNSRLDTHEARLNNHSNRIDKLEQYQSRAEEQVKQLCQQIKSLVTAMWWAMGLAISTLLGFVIWYIQSLGR